VPNTLSLRSGSIAQVDVLLIVIGVIKKLKKKTIGNPKPLKTQRPQQLANIETSTTGDTTTLSVELNASELKHRIENGTLNINEKKEVRLEDLAGFYGQQRKSPEGQYLIISADSYELNGKNKKGQLALIISSYFLRPLCSDQTTRMLAITVL
jgi:hypothetical protein